MIHLERLSPAETLILTQGEHTNLKDLLKVTMMDLLLKQVLQTTPHSPEPGSDTTYFHVISGPNLSGYHALEHERIFLEPFIRNHSYRTLFATLIKLARSKALTTSYYAKSIQSSAQLHGCFEHGLSRLFKGKFSLTPHGKTVKGETKAELDALSEILPDLLINDPAKSLQIMKVIKGNIFLVKGVDFKLMEEIEKQLIAETHYSNEHAAFSDSMTWLALTHHFTLFDDSRNSDSSVGDSWTSSDAGDSDAGGDSGCGSSGCGGD
jgi:hypothetical protein